MCSIVLKTQYVDGRARKNARDVRGCDQRPRAAIVGRIRPVQALRQVAETTFHHPLRKNFSLNPITTSHRLRAATQLKSKHRDRHHHSHSTATQYKSYTVVPDLSSLRIGKLVEHGSNRGSDKHFGDSLKRPNPVAIPPTNFPRRGTKCYPACQPTTSRRRDALL